ncbi:alpha/beta fold hydrolase [Bacillus mangrovi]|uniref:Alpha/beta fold hydrolase n=1 Tax=Metabacillus mangrovi TaxID=1491830 RepID=A0A7X2S7R0_9BACI|nr:alpha/beta fold hydrolase [Metabacillus mangrovi]MTH54922.1 alpha/beta fold hydrolase [Metabacillus mangrovi]
MKNLAAMISFALLLSFSILQPAPSKAAEQERNPVIFIHGAGGIGASFKLVENQLVKKGWNPDELYAIEMADKTGNNLTNGKQLERFVDKVKKETGKSKVDIIGHSAGGMNALYYTTKLGGAENVEDIVTLGAPNRFVGSTAPESIRYTSIYSTSDYIVRPQLAKLDGAKNIELRGVNHFAYLYNSDVQKLIEEGLNGGGE